MVKLPGPEDVEQVSPRRLLPQRVPQASAADFGGNIGEAVAGLGGAVFETSARLAEVDRRARARADAVARANDYGAGFEKVSGLLRTYETTRDLSKESDLAAFRQDLDSTIKEIIQGHEGSEESKQRLLIQLAPLAVQSADRAAVMGTMIGRQRIERTLDTQFAQVAERAARDPGGIAQYLTEIDAVVADKIDGLDPGTEDVKRAIGKERVGLAIIQQHLDLGDFEGADEVRQRPEIAGLLSSDLQNNLRSRITAARTEGDKIKTKAIAEAKAKAAVFRMFAGRDPRPGEALAFSDLVKIPEPAKDEFNRNLNDLLALEAKENDGSLSPGETRRKLFLQKRLERQTQESGQGFAIQFNPDGTVAAVMQGPAQGLGAGLEASRALNEQAQVDRLGVVLGTLDTAISQIKESPTRAGIAGSFRNFAQKLIGVAGDVAPSELADSVRASAQRFGLSGFFDAALPEMEIYENTIALELAKLRVLSGGGGIRAIESAFRAAKNDVAIRGLTFGSQEAETRLRAVREEFETERGNLIRRLSGQSPAGATRATTQEEVNVLPKGTRFLWIDGETYTKD